MNLFEDALTKLMNLGAKELAHTNGDLAEHLKGTYFLLKSWGNADFICLAGLYHAIYGTSGFPEQLVSLDRRKEIVDIIGAEAEALVYFYSACDRTYTYAEIIHQSAPSYRDRFTGEIYLPTKAALSSFCELTLANELEIARGNQKIRDEYGERLVELFQKMEAYVSFEGFQYFEKVFKIKQVMVNK